MNINSTLFLANGAFNIPLGAVAIAGNLLVLVSIPRTPSLISPSNVLLLSLAFTDLCVGLVVQPLYIALKFVQLTDAGKNFEILIGVHFYCAQYLCLVSFVNVTLLSVDRFLALYVHLRYHEFVTVKRTAGLLGGLLIFCAICVSSGKWLPKFMTRVIAIIIAGIAQIVNTVLYYNIYRICRRHQLQINSQRHSVRPAKSLNITSRLKRSFINMFYIYLVFTACYLPYMVMAVFKSKLPLSIFEISCTFVYLNSSLNPLLFSWRIQGIRTAIKRTLRKASQWLWCR